MGCDDKGMFRTCAGGNRIQRSEANTENYRHTAGEKRERQEWLITRGVFWFPVGTAARKTDRKSYRRCEHLVERSFRLDVGGHQAWDNHGTTVSWLVVYSSKRSDDEGGE